MQGDNSSGLNAKLGSVTVELEETKQSLQRAKEESLRISNSLSSAKQELQRTKQELQQIKNHGYSEKRRLLTEEVSSSSSSSVTMIVDDVEHLKFEAKDSNNKFENKTQKYASNKGKNGGEEEEKEEGSVEFQKKRYVTFAKPPSLTRLIVPPQGREEVLERSHSLKKKKNKKPFIPLIRGILSKKKFNS